MGLRDTAIVAGKAKNLADQKARSDSIALAKQTEADLCARQTANSIVLAKGWIDDIGIDSKGVDINVIGSAAATRKTGSWGNDSEDIPAYTELSWVIDGIEFRAKVSYKYEIVNPKPALETWLGKIAVSILVSTRSAQVKEVSVNSLSDIGTALL